MRDRRRKTIGGVLSALFLVVIVLAATGGSGLAAGSSGSTIHVLAGAPARTLPKGMIVGHSLRNDISPSLRSMSRGKPTFMTPREAGENPSLAKGRTLR